MSLPQTQSTPHQQPPQPVEAAPQGKESVSAPATSDATLGSASNNDPASANGSATVNGDSHEQHATSDGLAPLESMDTGMDGEYDSDEDDDDMEEVV